MIYRFMYNNPRHAATAADFLRSTELIGQFQTLDEDQEQGCNRICGQKTRHGDDKEAPAMYGAHLLQSVQQ